MGLIKSIDYEHHIIKLAQKVLEDSSLAILLKTQFKRNVLYKN